MAFMDTPPGRTSVPPPPPELNIRTMESDIRSFGKSGGSSSRLEMTSALSILQTEAVPKKIEEPRGIARKMLIPALILGFLAVVALAGYFLAYPLLRNLTDRPGV